MNSKLPKAWLFSPKAVHEFPLWAGKFFYIYDVIIPDQGEFGE